MSDERFSLHEAVRAALTTIYDPCSVAAGRPTSLLDMGLALDWRLDEDATLHVRFCVTFAGCTMAPHFLSAANEALSQLSGVKRVNCWVDTDHVWLPEAAQISSTPMRGVPQAWRSRIASS